MVERDENTQVKQANHKRKRGRMMNIPNGKCFHRGNMVIGRSIVLTSWPSSRKTTREVNMI